MINSTAGGRAFVILSATDGATVTGKQKNTAQGGLTDTDE